MCYTHKKFNELVLKKFHRIIKCKQKAWLKSYIDMNTVLKKRGKCCFEKYFFRLINNAFFGKIMENVRKNRDIKLLKTKRRTKIFPENLLAMVMKQKQIVMNKPVYLGLSI